MLTGGGGICGDCLTKGYLEKNVECFSPPYLFRKDGSGLLASRPLTAAAPTTSGYGQALAIDTPQAGTIGKVGLVRLGAPTHSEDQGQRYVPLSFTASGTRVRATSPATSNLAPAGYYMLFVTDTAGVPSVAKIIRLQRGLLNPSPPAGTLIAGVGARCVDVEGGAAVDHAALWMNACSSSASQRWVSSTADRPLRSLGRCVEVAGNPRRSTARVELNTCAAGSRQGWERRDSDRTIRSAAAPSLRLQPKAGSTAYQARLEVATCAPGAVAQRWTWRREARRGPGRTKALVRGPGLLVGDTGIEPVTSSVSGKRATAAPIA